MSTVSPLRFSGAVLDIPLSTRERKDALTMPQLMQVADYLDRRRSQYSVSHEVYVYQQEGVREGDKDTMKAAITTADSPEVLEVLKSLLDKADRLRTVVDAGSGLGLADYMASPVAHWRVLSGSGATAKDALAVAEATSRLYELA